MTKSPGRGRLITYALLFTMLVVNHIDRVALSVAGKPMFLPQAS